MHVGDPPELNKVLPSFAAVKAVTKPSKDADLPVDILLLTVTNCSQLVIVSLKTPTDVGLMVLAMFTFLM